MDKSAYIEITQEGRNRSNRNDSENLYQYRAVTVQALTGYAS
jgi:hypothetical protein